MNNEVFTAPVKAKKPRLNYIDVAKFLGLFAVSISHIAGGDLQVTLIDSFNLCLFFVLTGYTLSRREDDTFGSYLLRKIKGYVFTLFWMNVLIMLIQICFFLGYKQYDAINLNYFLNEWIGFLGEYRRHALWFIACLFFCTLLMYPMMKYDFHKWYLKLLYLILPFILGALYQKYIHIWMHWNLDNVLMGTFYVYLGYLFSHKIPWKDKVFFRNRWIALIWGIVLFASCILLSYYQNIHFHQGPSWYMENYGILYLTAPAGILGSFGIIFLSYGISNVLFAEFGRANLIVLAIQQELIMRHMREISMTKWWNQINALDNVNSWNRLLFGVVGATLAVLVGYLIYFLLVHSHLAFMVNEKRKSFRHKKST